MYEDKNEDGDSWFVFVCQTTVLFYLSISFTVYCKIICNDFIFTSKNSNFILFCSHTYSSSTLSEEKPSSDVVCPYTSCGTWDCAQVAVDMVQKTSNNDGPMGGKRFLKIRWFPPILAVSSRNQLKNRRKTEICCDRFFRRGWFLEP
jgi:hypothetical protein